MEYLKYLKDEACPKCGAPVTVIIAKVDQGIGTPVYRGCQSDKCGWIKKITPRKSKKTDKKTA